MSNQLKIIESDDDIDKKEIYFMILKQTKEKEKYNEFNFTSAIKPQIIYEKQIAKENKECIDHKVFKFTIKENRSNEQEETPLNNYQIKYQEGNNNYIISFSAKNNSFIYDIELKQVANYLNEIIEETFDQNIIPLYNKLDIFIEALNINNENEKLAKLYEDTIELLENEEKNNFIKKLLDKYIFTKEEFYSNDDNKKIKLLCDLNEGGKLKDSDIDSCQLVQILDNIRYDIDNGMISKKSLEKFLGEDDKMSNKMDLTIKKLGLMKLIIDNYDPIKKYHELKKIICDINKTIDTLMYIKNSLIIYHKNQYLDEIKKIIIIVNEIETKPIREFKNQEMKESIERLMHLKDISDEINKVKDFLLFNEIYENTQGRDKAERFDDGLNRLREIKSLFEENSSNIETIFEKYEENSSNIETIFEKYRNIFCNIKGKLSKKGEYISDKFVEQMKDYFNIKDEKITEDLIILIKSKKYEVVIKGIKYFFDCLNKKLVLPTNLALSQMNLNSIKMVLQQLKKENIYDYQSKNLCYKIFTSFYGKREAIDFLLSKINVDINNLKF